VNDTQPPARKVYLIAGEPSGDILGARLMAALKLETAGNVEFVGVGGPEMAEQGLNSLFPMADLAVMGVVEVLHRLPLLLRRISETTADVLKQNPDVLVTIDSPDFCFRVAKRLKGQGIPLVHYVAPSVWAWRPGRAAKVAGFLDHLLTLLPFEPPYFEKEGLSTSFVGHPVVEGPAMNADGPAFRRRHNIKDDETVIVALPGSRSGEVSRHLPVFAQTFLQLQQNHGDFHVVLVTTGTVAEAVRSAASNWSVPVSVIDDVTEKYDAMASGNVALAASGTVALELAAVGTPAIITYRVSPLTAFFGKMLIKVQFANLINLILGREAVPERIQDSCRADVLSADLLSLLNAPDAVRKQLDDCHTALQALSGDGKGGPALLAARAVLKVISAR
jgi:lipid-A-disaccharide synthase